MFSEEEKKAFKNLDIRDAFKVIGEYSLYLEWDDDFKIIKIRLEESLDGKIQFVQSHYIKTPAQASHYTGSRSWGGSADNALKRAVDTVMSYYSEAIKAGHKPNDAGLLKIRSADPSTIAQIFPKSIQPSARYRRATRWPTDRLYEAGDAL